jgi:hypothetical protein
MSQDLIVHQPALIPFREVEQMGRVMAASKLFGIQSEPQAIALMLLCQSENLHPAVAMRDFHIISGRPALKADAMLSRFKAAGGKVKWHRYDDDGVEATFTAPDGDNITLDWTPARVQQAQLGGNAMHKKFPRQMLKARCISEGIRAVYPGVLSGLYAPEEVRDITGPADTQSEEYLPREPEPRPEPPAPAPRTEIPADLLAKLAACRTVDECRMWIPATRIALNLQGPQDPLYQAVIAAGKARAEELAKPADPLTAVPEPAAAVEPHPEPLEDLEPLE